MAKSPYHNSKEEKQHPEHLAIEKIKGKYKKDMMLAIYHKVNRMIISDTHKNKLFTKCIYRTNFKKMAKMVILSHTTAEK